MKQMSFFIRMQLKLIFKFLKITNWNQFCFRKRGLLRCIVSQFSANFIGFFNCFFWHLFFNALYGNWFQRIAATRSWRFFTEMLFLRRIFHLPQMFLRSTEPPISCRCCYGLVFCLYTQLCQVVLSCEPLLILKCPCPSKSTIR